MLLVSCINCSSVLSTNAHHGSLEVLVELVTSPIYMFITPLVTSVMVAENNS
jgi:hypothetical protein